MTFIPSKMLTNILASQSDVESTNSRLHGLVQVASPQCFAVMVAASNPAPPERRPQSPARAPTDLAWSCVPLCSISTAFSFPCFERLPLAVQICIDLGPASFYWLPSGHRSTNRARKRDQIMPANIRIPDGVTPSVNNGSMSKSSPVDVWFTWSLTNAGDEDGDTNGIRWALQDPNGGTAASDNAPPQSIPVGSTVEQGASIPSSSFSTAGTYWANLVDTSGENLGGARIEVSD
jgi:hypothetical protein